MQTCIKTGEIQGRFLGIAEHGGIYLKAESMRNTFK